MESFWDDLRRVLSGPGLMRLSTLQTSRLVPVLYAVGLWAVLVWAVAHLVAGFAAGLGPGIWGLIETVVFGGFMVLALRTVCEAFLILFARSELPRQAKRPDNPGLFDEVREAIHELARDDDDGIAPATDPAPFIPDDAYADIEAEPPARPAKRTRRRSTPRT